MKTTFFHGLMAGILASLASITFNLAYSSALWVDFSKVINTYSIFGSCILGTLLLSLGYFYFSKMVKKRTEVWFNILLLTLTFASFVGSFSAELPLEIDSPELFVGLSIPLHLFPALFWLGTKPLFYRYVYQ